MRLRLSSLLCLILLATATNAQEATKTAKVTKDGAELQLVADGYSFTEGPAVDQEGNVYFTDQPNDRILKWSLDGSVETWLQPCGRSNGLYFMDNGELLACADGENELWKISQDKKHEVVLKGTEGKLFNGPNDVWVGGDGTIYFTDPLYPRPYWKHRDAEQQLPKRVYRLDPETQELSVAAADFVQPNGIVGDAKQRKLFVADIGDRKTYRFEIAEDGSLSNRTLFCNQGSDGMTLDDQGNLYLTGKGVLVFNAEGEQIQTIEVPEGWTANVCFGGADRKTLFITASDSLYTIDMTTRGL